MEPHPYSCTIPAEPLHRYRVGGYHPVYLGDFLKDGRYRIIHKLGFGGYSTVWLAKDEELQRYVAVKIAVAEVGLESRELQVLRVLSANISTHSGSQHVVQLLDDFQHAGPNGTHTCLVFEVLGPNIPTVIDARFADGRLPGKIARRVCKHALLGLDFLHQHQVGHGDLHTGNIAFTLPSLDPMPEEEVLKQLPTPEIGDVTRLDGKALGPGVPKYLVWPGSFRISKTTLENPIKIIDFGESFTRDTRPKTLHTPLAVRAPEVIFEDDIDFRVDLWSMGCMIFELVTGQPPFDSLMTTKEILVSEMIQFVGELPERWQRKWALMEKEESTDPDGLTLQLWLEEVYFDDEKTADFTREDIRELGALLRKLLRFQPTARSTTTQVLKDDWFQSPQPD
ncbi:CMGC/SRPK protein kinase [Coniosporium apollinis CBS 100218]|uniref:non-specific serine/threonine protein kinase n=1 Tax=Coniosporium apollinis (strain CBS 100218) TaxID=1168221 RepID=R7YTR3_CONA1|nr:CMGC/SRPK protein kinase [Coniosporium apollinis CBS 100218]EON65280.1 CMGC/SRPK protein kinase [Coniosporium apollinis CBS 100218]